MAFDMPNRRTFLQISGLAAGAALLPLSATGVQAKKPNAVFDLDFSDADDAADNTSSSAGWVVDRRAPESWTTDSGRLCIDIDESAEKSGFYRYQGKKYQDADGEYWNAGTGSRLSYSFYIDPAWETDGEAHESGVWPVLGNANGGISAYPILAYQDSDASDTGDPQFRTYVYESDEDGNFDGAKWIDLGLPKKLGIDPEAGGWVDIEAQLQQFRDGAALKWRINDKLVVDERGYNVFAPSTQFLEFIFNSINFGTDATYHYDDVVLSTPGNARNK
ncbi:MULTISPECIES: hypothetical protein [Haloarcula]|uniref:hypothetical protein n=1 Tax=Haloarcula TaxID=2237 RepID=UPI0023ECB89F|nr:hypothetical protein [Halomicroarcula sp. XH51]